MSSEELREPAALAEVARALRTIHELGEPLPVTFDSFRIVETYAETAVGAARRSPTPTRRPTRVRPRSRRR